MLETFPRWNKKQNQQISTVCLKQIRFLTSLKDMQGSYQLHSKNNNNNIKTLQTKVNEVINSLQIEMG